MKRLDKSRSMDNNTFRCIYVKVLLSICNRRNATLASLSFSKDMAACCAPAKPYGSAFILGTFTP